MKYKKIMILTIILVSLFAISAVSAADNTTDDAVSVEETDEISVVTEDNNIVGLEDKHNQNEDNVFTSYSDFEVTNVTETKIDTVLNVIDNDVTLKDRYGNPLSNQSLSYTISKITQDYELIIIKTSFVITDNGGNAIIPTAGIPQGSNILKVSFNGNEQYNSVLISRELIIRTYVPENYPDIANDDSIGTFDELYGLIENTTEGTTLELHNDYKYVNGSTEGIRINKSITIDGNNHTLDGNKLASILKVSASKVTIKNINFINGKLYPNNPMEGGGAIYWTGSEGRLYNCTFFNNEVVLREGYCCEGGAISWSGKSGTIKDCKFINNNATFGGAFKVLSYGGTISNCIFEYNHAECGGAIEVRSNQFTINNCSFIFNSANFGSAILSTNDYCSISNCIFEYNTATRGTYYHDGGRATLSKCTFSDNVANSYHNVYTREYSSLTMINNIFGCKSNIYANNITYGEVVNVRGSLNFGVNCNLNISLWEGDNKVSDYILGDESQFDASMFSVKLSNLPSGNHILKIIVNDNKNTYIYKKDKCIFKVTPLFTKINTTNISSSYKENSYLVATLINNYGKFLSNLDIDVNVSGNITTLTTDNNGQIEFNTNNLPAGMHTALITFNGNYMYDKSYAFSTIVINKISSKINVFDLNTYYGFNDNLTATLKNEYGSLPNSTVNVSINGEEKIMTTNSKGQIILNSKELDSGRYLVNITFEGDNNHFSSSKVITILINKLSSKLEPSYINTAYNSEGEFKIATLKDQNGNLLSNLEVNVTLDIGKIYSNIKTDLDGQVKLPIIGLIPDIYTATITFENKNYIKSSSTSLIIIKKATPNIIIPSFDNLSCNSSVEVTLPNDAAGTVTLTINDEDYFFDVVNGIAKVKLPNLDNGNYEYIINYSGDNKYYSFTTNGSLKVNKTALNPSDNTTNATGNTTNTNTTNTTGVNALETNTTKSTPEVIIPPLDEPSEDGLIPVTLPNDATGTVTLTVDGKNHVFDVVDGKANVKLSDLSNGDYPYVISYSGDAKYKSFTTSGSLKVNNTTPNPSDNTTNTTDNTTHGNTTNTNTTNTTGGNASETNTTKPTPEIVIPPLDEPSDVGFVEVKLPSDAKGNVTLTINNTDYVFEVVNGVANVVMPKLDNGNYSYTIIYSGDTKYSSFIEEGRVNIAQKIVTVKAKNMTVTYGSGHDFIATFFKADGSPLDNTYVVFTVNGNDTVVKTDSNGIAVLNIGLGNGTYNIISTNLVTGESVNNVLTIVGEPAPILGTVITASPVTTVYNGGKNLVITLKDVTGKPVSGVKVTIVLGGKTYTPNTDKNGQIKLTTNGLKPVKKYTATITFKGTNIYEKSSTTANIKINKANPKFKYSAATFKRTDKKKKYTIRFLTNQNTAMKNAKVYIKVNKKVYAAKTNKKGFATFKLTKLTKKGKYTANIIFKGDGYYNKLTKNVKIKVR